MLRLRVSVAVGLPLGLGVGDADDVETDAAGKWTFVTDLNAFDLEPLSTGVLLRVRVDPYGPDARTPSRVYQFSFAGMPADQLMYAANVAASDLVYEIDLAGCGDDELALKPLDGAALAGVDRCLVRIGEGLTIAVPNVSGQFVYNAGFKANAIAERSSGAYRGTAITAPIAPPMRHWLRWEIDDGQDRGTIVARTPLLDFPLAQSRMGVVQQVEETITVGSINAEISARIFDSGIVLYDLDVDFVAGKIRLIGRAGVGTSEDALLLSVCRFEVDIEPSLVDYDDQPFQRAELDELVAFTLTRLEVDALPGTDLDELPWWAVLLLGLATGGVGLLGRALIELIEAIIRKVIRKRIRPALRQVIATQVRKRVRDEIDDQLARLDGLSIDKERIHGALFFHGRSLEVSTDALIIRGYAGLWDPIVIWLVGAEDCAFADSAAASPAPLPAMTAFRQFESLLGQPGLRPWMERYTRHRPGLAAAVKRDPALGAALVAFAMRHATSLRPETRLEQAHLDELRRLHARLERVSTRELLAFVDDVLAVLEVGRTFAELRDRAMERMPPRRRPPRPPRRG